MAKGSVVGPPTPPSGLVLVMCLSLSHKVQEWLPFMLEASPHLQDEVHHMWWELNNQVVLRVSWLFLAGRVLTSVSTVLTRRLVYEVSLQGTPPGLMFLIGSVHSVSLSSSRPHPASMHLEET